MPDKKTQGEEILDKQEWIHDEPIDIQYGVFEALCNIGTQLERIAGRMDDILETGLPTR